MLVISKDQISSLERPLRRRLGQEVVDSLRRSAPHALQGLEASEIRERLDMALAGADLYELNDVRDLQAYVRLCFTIGPRFDEHPPFKSILTAQHLLPRRRMSTLFARAAASDWVLASVGDIVSRYRSPLELASATLTSVDARAIALVPLGPQYAEQYFRLSLHPDVWRLAGLLPCPSLEACVHYLQQFGVEPGKRGLALVNERVGLVGAISLFQGNSEARLSYWVGRPFWGQGVATVALGELTGRLKSPGGLFRLMAEVCLGNSMSVRVLEKNGFSLLKDVEYASGRSNMMHYIRAF